MVNTQQVYCQLGLGMQSQNELGDSQQMMRLCIYLDSFLRIFVSHSQIGLLFLSYLRDFASLILFIYFSFLESTFIVECFSPHIPIDLIISFSQSKVNFQANHYKKLTNIILLFKYFYISSFLNYRCVKKINTHSSFLVGSALCSLVFYFATAGLFS